MVAWQRFWSKVSVVGNVCECWEWVGRKNEEGYGVFDLNVKPPRRSHGVSWQLFNGDIPGGMHLDHLCRNRACVNPWHLEPVTSAENTRRGEAGKHNATKTHCPVGHAYSGENLVLNSNKSRECRICKRARSARYKQRIRTT